MDLSMSWLKDYVDVDTDIKDFVEDITLSGSKVENWSEIGSEITNVVTGKVARMTDFGAFVELEPGVDALLHVSQISREHVAKPADVLSIGQEITAKIVDFNEADRKISLSMKALQAPAEQNEADAE